MDYEHRKQIGDRVRARRNELGWSQAKTGQLAGVSENTVISIEAAKQSGRGPQEAKVQAVLAALGIASPADSVVNLDGVPEEAALFILAAIERFRGPLRDDEHKRSRVLSKLYPTLLDIPQRPTD